MAVGQHVNIIQHPRGRRKEVSLQKNTITNVYQNRIRYTTDTEPGSSGSIVCNNAWDLIAIHHAGGLNQNGVWINNEGMRIDKIVANLKSHFSSSPVGNKILKELGI
jgi:V8-like Glu-specific endopeptidase